MPNQSANGVNNQVTGSSIADILVSMKLLTPERAQQIKMAEVQYGTTQEDIIRKQN